ncbi:MAG: tetratricopeptide repeat protein, partial [Candidatus Thorarchaeota archaeon]
IKIDPQYALAWSNKGLALDNLGKYEEAISCYDEAIKIDPQYALAWSNKGLALDNLGKYEEAISCYDEAIKIDPQYAQAYFNLGLTFLDLYQYKNAISNLQEAKELYIKRKSKIDINKTAGYQLWAEALQNWSREKYDKAISQFSEAVILFRNLNYYETADSLELITKIIPLDHQFMNAIQAQSLSELKEKISEVYKGIQNLLDTIKEKNISEDVEEILAAKIHCFTALYNALQFKKVDFGKLDKAKKTFEKFRFDTSVIAVNSLDTIIRVLRKEKSLDAISDAVQDSLLHELNSLSVLDGVLTEKIPIKKERFTSESITRQEPEIKFHFIDTIPEGKDWTRICLVQLDFQVGDLPVSEGFGYIVKEKEDVKKKIFEALEIAKKYNIDIICFPELSTTKEWVDLAKKYNMIIIFGSYYSHGFNTCPIIVNGQDYYIQKINPSPQFETEIVQGMKMKKGKKIFALKTKCGTFAVLICIDYLKEGHRIVFNSNKEIRSVDFIIVPTYNEAKERFQKKGDVDCQEGSHPYILQVNPWRIEDKEVGGTCVIGTEHKGALKRYKDTGLKPDDDIQYKLIEPQEESMIIVDLDIKRKGVPVPASGPKMQRVQKYVYENEKWNSISWG